MSALNLRYLWAATGRKGRMYWYYRRGEHRVPITSPEGQRLRPGDVGFLDAYERVHFSFQTDQKEAAVTGTLAHLIEVYRASPDYASLAPATRKGYAWDLEILKRDHGHRAIATMPREAVLKIRDEYSATPRKANHLLTTLRLILSFAEDRPSTFHLPRNWKNPARRFKRLKTAGSYRPWEESEIEAFRKCWPIGTLERTLFETSLNTGQRSSDVAPMTRQHYYKGEISVVQRKTNARVWIPASRDLGRALDVWLRSHSHPLVFPTKKGRVLTVNHMEHLMRSAMRTAGVPDDCKLHGLRHTFATRGIELGLDWQTIESIVGHRTAQMAALYTAQRRNARLMIATLDAGTGENKRRRRSENRR